MRDKVLACAFGISVLVHLIAVGLAGRTSAARTIHSEQPKMLRVEMIDITPSASKPISSEPAKAPSPPPKPITITPPIRPITSNSQSKPGATRIAKQPWVGSGEASLNTVSPHRNEYPRENQGALVAGNPGGPVNLGPPSRSGIEAGPSGITPMGTVPGTPGGRGAGSGSGPGTSPPEPVKGAVDGPGRTPAPAPPPPAPAPPPPKNIEIRVCAESGKLPGPNCERTVVKSFRQGTEPTTQCTTCKKIEHHSIEAESSNPVLISGPKKPKYPASAKLNGIEGSVTLEYTIDTEGKVVNIKVYRSSGSSILDQAAIEAVESRRYKPAMQGGIPRNYRMREPFRFTLD